MYAFSIVFSNLTCTQLCSYILLSLTESLNFIIKPISTHFIGVIMLKYDPLIYDYMTCFFLNCVYFRFRTFLHLFIKTTTANQYFMSFFLLVYIYNYVSIIHLILSHCNNVKASFRYVLQEINSFIRINVIFIFLFNAVN